MNNDAYSPPKAFAREVEPPRGFSHWFMIPGGVLLACATVFVAKPMLVDLLMGLFAPSFRGGRQMLVLEVQCHEQDAYERAEAEPEILPRWYPASSLTGVVLAWLASAIYVDRRMRRPATGAAA